MPTHPPDADLAFTMPMHPLQADLAFTMPAHPPQESLAFTMHRIGRAGASVHNADVHSAGELQPRVSRHIVNCG